MKNELENIDQLFKNAFENYEAHVDASAWNNIQQPIGSSAGNAAASSNAASIASKSIFLKVASAIVISSAVVATSIIVYNNYNTPTTPLSENLTPANEEQVVTPITVAETPTTNPEINTNTNEPAIIKEASAEIEKVTYEKVATTTPSTTEKPTNSSEKVATSSTTSTEKNTSSTTEKANTVTANSTIPSPNNNQNNSVLSPAPTPFVIEVKTNVTKGDAPLYVEFNAEGNATKYKWNFNDGSKNEEQATVYHTFLKPGTYEVILEAKDKYNQTTSSTIHIEVTSSIKSSLAEIKKIITPNGDGKNDILKIEGENIESFQVSVLNQNGKPIFEWNTIDGFWDGRDMNNNILPDGTYYISGVAIGVDGVKHLIKQSITLRK